MLVIVGGTGEARRVAELVDHAGAPVTTTLAGRTDAAAPIAGNVRRGGFGSTENMVSWLRQIRATAMLDATHPFAAAMHHRCAEVADVTGLALLRLERPSWITRPDSGTWHLVSDHAAALAAIHRRPALVTVGHQHAHAYDDDGVIARMTQPPAVGLAHAEVLVARGPFTHAEELSLFRRRGVATLVTKDSGGWATAAKLDAAAECGVDVVMIRRPPLPVGVATALTVPAAAAWLLNHRQV